jgi:hypothetical protein
LGAEQITPDALWATLAELVAASAHLDGASLVALLRVAQKAASSATPTGKPRLAAALCAPFCVALGTAGPRLSEAALLQGFRGLWHAARAKHASDHSVQALVKGALDGRRELGERGLRIAFETLAFQVTFEGLRHRRDCLLDPVAGCQEPLAAGHLEAIAFGITCGVRRTPVDPSGPLQPLCDAWGNLLARYVQARTDTLPFATRRALMTGFVNAAGYTADDGDEDDTPEPLPESLDTPETA